MTPAEPNTTRAAPQAGDDSRPTREHSDRPRVQYVDAVHLDWLGDRSSNSDDAAPAAPRRFMSVDEPLAGVRADVRDAAGAVLRWLAAMVDHRGADDLDTVLDRCLRPGGDVERINYTAMAEQIRETIGVELSSKRVQTAIRHLRSAREQHHETPSSRDESPVDELTDSLGTMLSGRSESLGLAPQREIAIETLAAVRWAAGRLIENDFAEGVPDTVDTEALAQRFSAMLQDTLSTDRATTESASDSPLLVLRDCLQRYEPAAEHDMRLVLAGSRAVMSLLGSASLAGLVAQLNVVVTGRDLLGSAAYRQQLIRIADAALPLIDCPDTKRFLTWVRRRPESQRLPSPIRLRSYCLNNAATHVFDRLFTGELADPDGRCADEADAWLGDMRSRDGGFALLPVTELIGRLARARLTGDTSETLALLRGWGHDRALDTLLKLHRHDNCRELVEAARRLAGEALPSLRHQIIAVG